MTASPASLTIFGLLTACGDAGASASLSDGTGGPLASSGTEDSAPGSGSSGGGSSGPTVGDDGSSGGDSSGGSGRCGDGVLEPLEACDDGNAVDGDGCSATCTVEVPENCGDGVVDDDEACDDGNLDDSDGCLSTCAAASCGDGHVWTGHETCDDGNEVDGDGCSSACVSELCGNGELDLQEQCDDGDANGAQGGDCFDTCILIDAYFDRSVFAVDETDGAHEPDGIDTGDFNGDGRLDLAIVGTNDVNVLYGFGDGRFWPPNDANLGTFASDFELADVNGDGRLDAVSALIYEHAIATSLGGGTTFEAPTSYSAQYAGVGQGPRGLALGDVDEDGDLDAVVANGSSDTVTVMLGDGTGAFVATASLSTAVGPAGDNPYDVALSDVDDDGRLDIITCNRNSDDVTLRLGQGEGDFGSPVTFTTRVGAGGEAPRMLVMHDVSGDGVPDAIVVSSASDDVVVLDAEPETAGFSTPLRLATASGAGGQQPWAVAVGDLDADGQPDLVTANRLSDDIAIFMGLGGGTAFEPAVLRSAAVADDPDPSTATGDLPMTVAIADLDADGDLDIVTGNLYSDDLSVLINEGDATYAEPVAYELLSSPAGGLFNVRVADIDGDGEPDVVSNMDGHLIVTAGLGGGRLAPSQSTSVSSSRAIAVGELTGELGAAWVTGGLGVVVGARQTVSGAFFTEQSGMSGSTPSGLALGDLDGDAGLDVVAVSTSSGTLCRARNEVGPAFGDVSCWGAGESPRSVVLGDVTGDGSLDAISVSMTDEVFVFRGLGDGGFDFGNRFPVNQGSSGLDPRDVAVADVTGDGVLDVLTANFATNDVSVLENEGDGIFMPATVVPVTFEASAAEVRGIGVGDFDGDGELDFATVNQGRDTISVVFGFGGGAFSAPQEFGVGGAPSDLVVRDFDGDGLDDIASTDAADGTVSVHLSNGHGG